MSKAKDHPKSPQRAAGSTPALPAVAPSTDGRAWWAGVLVAMVLMTFVAAIAAYVAWRHQRPAEAPRVAIPAPPLPQPDLSGVDVLVREKLESLVQAARQNPQSAEAWGRLAMTLDVHNFVGEAVPCYEHAAALDPSSHRWPYLLGILMSRHATGDPIPMFARATQLRPSYAPAHLRYAEALLNVGRTDEAVAAAKSALAADADHPHAHFILARAALSRDDLEAAKRHVEFLTSRRPVLQGTHLLAADLSRRLGDTAAAARHDEAFRTTSYTPHVDDPVWGGMQAEKTGAAAEKDRGMASLASRNFPAAERAFRQALRVSPDSDTLAYLAAALVGQGRLPDARDAARQALELDPSSARAYEQLARAHAGAGEWRDAVAALRGGMDMTSRDARLARLLAGMLATAPDTAIRDGPEAVRLTQEVMSQAGEAAASDPRLLDQLAMAYASAGQFPEAAHTVRRAIEAAQKAGMARQAQDMERRLALYLTNRPYIETRW
jgi:tetratricopeptide (TPR) repeat protein